MVSVYVKHHVYLLAYLLTCITVREPIWPSGKALLGLGSIPLLLAFLFKELWFMDTVFLTLPLTINRILKRLSSLRVLMQESLWW